MSPWSLKRVYRALSGFSGLFFCTVAVALSTIQTEREHVTMGDGMPEDANIHYIGRWDTRSQDVAISYWPGAYFKTAFSGTTVRLKLADPASFYACIDNGDDVYYEDVSGVINLTPVPLSPGLHTLRIAARTEWVNIHFQGLQLDPGATTLPPQVLPYLIEFIGDSVTSGLTGSKAALTDYAWLAGEYLGVEHTQIAFSGIRLVPSPDGENVGMSIQYFKERTQLFADSPDWDFQRYQPQIVVINLGSNDASNVTYEQFQDTYVSFIQSIRQKYSNAIIVVFGTALGFLMTPTQEAVRIVREAGDANVHFIETSGWISYGPDYNDGAHPSDVGQAKIARRLTPLLAAYLPDAVVPPQLHEEPPLTTLPEPWQTMDVGATWNINLTGAASYEHGAFTIAGAGDMLGNERHADAFRYVYQSLYGDGSITACVVALQDTDPLARAGVMIRETLTLGSMHVSMLAQANEKAAFVWRPVIGSETSTIERNRIDVPYWVKIVRQGNLFTGMVSADGRDWTEVGSDTIVMARDIYIGLCVNAHNNALLNTSVFTSVNITL